MTILLKAVVFAVLISLWTIGSMELRTLAAAMLVLTFVDAKNPLILKNIFLVYTFCLFILAGNFFFPEANDLFADMLVYVSSYLVGYHVFAQIGRHHSRSSRPLRASSHDYGKHIKLLEHLTFAYMLVPFVLFVVKIHAYGYSEFYRGAAMADLIESYVENGLSSSQYALIYYCASLFQTALCVYYTSCCLRAGKRPRYLFLAILLVGIPLISLNRSEAVHGCMFLAIITLFGTARSGLGMSKWLWKILAGSAVVVGLAIVIGQLRVDRITGGGKSDVSMEDKFLKIIYGEFAPIVMYGNIKWNIEALGYQYGQTIGLPLLFKPIPRTWMPKKPENTSTLYMKTFAPQSYDAGFSLAPSLFSDLYLNFGWYGCLVVSGLLGCVTARLDHIFLSRDVYGFPTYALVYCNFYSLLRSNTGDAIGLMLITVAAYLILKHLFGYIVKCQTQHSIKRLSAGV